jgi:eukaryotic-like serine/threonine-protein kinase
MGRIPLRTVWEETRDSGLFRVLALYLSGCFVALQVVDLFVDQLGLPDWVFPGSLILCVAGLPVVVLTAAAQRERGKPTAAGPVDQATALLAATATADAGSDSDPVRRWLTWRRSITAGIVTLAVWGVVISLYMTMRGLGIGPVGTLIAAGTLAPREAILVADFQSAGSDSLFASVVTEALRIDLEQSPVVTVVETSRVRQVLVRMGHSPAASLDHDLVLEVAQRAGVKAVLSGELASIGRGYVLSSRLATAETGEILIALRETAADSSTLLAAVDRLSAKLRERIGESLRTIRRGEPLDQVTTTSLEALRKYSRALRAIEIEGNREKGIALLEEAIVLDSTFAMAYRKLGVELGNQMRATGRQAEVLRKAYEHRHRLSERERYLTEAAYYAGVDGDVGSAIIAYRSLLDIHPDDPTALHNLALMYEVIGDHARAEATYLRAIRADSTRSPPYANLIVLQIARGALDDAALTLQRGERQVPGHPAWRQRAAMLAIARGDYLQAEREIRAEGDADLASPMRRTAATRMLAFLAAFQGRLDEAERLLQELEQLSRSDAQPAEALQYAILAAAADVVRGTPADGRRVLEAALQRYPLSSLPSAERPYREISLLYAWLGVPAEARRLLQEARDNPSPIWRRQTEIALTGVEGLALLEEGDARAAVVRLRAADAEDACRPCWAWDLGRAYEAAGQPDSAAATYERFVAVAPGRFVWNHLLWLAPAHERLAALHAAGGDTARSRHHAGRMAAIWAEADPILQPRVRAARRRAGGGD